MTTVPDHAVHAPSSSRIRQRHRRTGEHGGDVAAGGGVASAAQPVLSAIADGRLARLWLAVCFWDGSRLSAVRPGAAPPTVLVRDPLALRYLLREPNQLGLARAWVSGAIEVDNLDAVLGVGEHLAGLKLTVPDRARVLAAAVRVAGVGVLRIAPAPAIEARARGRRHSLARDRRAVRHHYDVSNRFYRLLLGPSLVYSCAYFSSPDETLEAAQQRKLELICRKLRLAPGERMLDIGCGWGSLVIHAARHHGAQAVGVTLSEPQAKLARERIAAAGLEQRVRIRVADYRDLDDGPYDKIASVGMYEHVGRSQLDDYARTVRALLRPGGLFLNHGIARLRSEAPSGETFISRYIFPDGELHPVGDLVAALAEARYELRDIESLREHYPLTLRRWLANFDRRREEIISLVGAERERAWRLYMLGSARAFQTAKLTVYQLLAARDGAPHGLPLNRTELTANRQAGEPRRARSMRAQKAVASPSCGPGERSR